jgi:hypothetical protein
MGPSGNAGRQARVSAFNAAHFVTDGRLTVFNGFVFYRGRVPVVIIGRSYHHPVWADNSIPIL